jgi:predicted nucleotidyltransferase
MRRRIEQALDDIETTERVRVLYAVESGSRAWGFASADSDWDVRFIYARPRNWYLSIEDRRDVLELPIDEGLDASGWDIRKALQLFAKSNPPLLEWLRSPFVYRETLSSISRLREISAEFFSPHSCMHHYLHMAEGNFREHFKRDTVRLKKYFYVLRPVLACCWIEAHGSMPPMEFNRLVEDQLPHSLATSVDALLERKRAGGEIDEGPALPEIHAFLEEKIAHFQNSLARVNLGTRPDMSVLDEVFRDCIAEAWEGNAEPSSGSAVIVNSGG